MVSTVTGQSHLDFNQSNLIELPYASAEGALLGHSISLGGTAMFWLGAALFLRRKRARRLAAVAIVGSGLVVLFLALRIYQLSATPAVTLSLIVIALVAAQVARRSLAEWRGLRLADSP